MHENISELIDIFCYLKILQCSIILQETEEITRYRDSNFESVYVKVDNMLV